MVWICPICHTRTCKQPSFNSTCVECSSCNGHFWIEELAEGIKENEYEQEKI